MNVLSVSRAVHIRFVRYTPVTHTVMCVSYPYTSVTHPFLMRYSCGIIRILHECQVWIDKSVPRVTFWHHEARRVMPNCDPRDRFVYPYLTRMMDSFSCSP